MERFTPRIRSTIWPISSLSFDKQVPRPSEPPIYRSSSILVYPPISVMGLHFRFLSSSYYFSFLSSMIYFLHTSLQERITEHLLGPPSKGSKLWLDNYSYRSASFPSYLPLSLASATLSSDDDSTGTPLLS